MRRWFPVRLSGDDIPDVTYHFSDYLSKMLSCGANTPQKRSHSTVRLSTAVGSLVCFEM